MCLRVLKESKKSRFDRYSRQKQCIDHIPYYLSGLSRAHFSDNLSQKIAVYSLWNNNKVSCNILCGLFEFINWMNSKKWTHFLMTNQVHCYITGNSNTFYLFLFPSRTNIRLFGSYFSIHELSHLKSLYYFCVTCNVSNYIIFYCRLFDFFFFPSGVL